MAKIEDAIADGVVADLDAGEVPAAHHGTFAPGGGPGTSPMHYGGPGTSQTGGHVSDLNGGPGTTPGVPYTIPGGGAEDAVVAQDREKDFAAVVAQTKIARAAASASFRAFCKGPVQGTGHVAGVQNIQAEHEREKP